MRTKSEAKRQAIVDVAAEVFREQGFERASMTDICTRVGGSKATIYNYFPSKDELFFEVVTQATAAEMEQVHQALGEATDDITETLQAFGARLIGFLYSTDIQNARRLVISEAGRGNLGKRCYALGASKSMADVAAFLEKAMDEGKLRRADPRTAAYQLKALYDAEFYARFMCHVLDELEAKEIEEAVGRAVATFMAAYGPDKSRSGAK